MLEINTTNTQHHSDNQDPAQHSASSTLFPDIFWDQLIVNFSPETNQVMVYIIRRTFGEQQMGAIIPIDEIVSGRVASDGTRLDYGANVSLSTVNRAIKELEEGEMIEVIRRYSETDGKLPNYYRPKLQQALHPLSTDQLHALQAVAHPAMNGQGYRTTPPKAG